MSRRRDRLDDLGRALDRLGEALEVPADAPLAVDGTIQRFEFTFELVWKCFKGALSAQGVEAASPLMVLREAFQMGWIDDETTWIQVLKDRNLSSRVYREEVALEIYQRLRLYAPRLREAHGAMTRLAE